MGQQVCCVAIMLKSVREYLHRRKYDDVIKWKHFPRYWPFVRGIHRSPVNSPHKGQWRGALMFSSICPWSNGWVNDGEAGDLKWHRAHYDAVVMWLRKWTVFMQSEHSLWFKAPHLNTSTFVNICYHLDQEPISNIWMLKCVQWY